MVKKVQKRAVVILSPEENRRVVQFVELLVTIARRVDAKRAVAQQAKVTRYTIKRTNTRNTEIQYLNTNKRKYLGRRCLNMHQHLFKKSYFVLKSLFRKTGPKENYILVKAQI